VTTASPMMREEKARSASPAVDELRETLVA
jgi:hypothetical protein